MENYQNQSFQGLLEQNRISEALQLRIETLEAEAYNTRLSLEASKAVTGGSLLLGVLLSANPMIALLAGVGGALYAVTLWQDYSSTRRLCPLPGMRRGVMELIHSAGAVDKGVQPVEEDPLLQVLSYLEPVAADEYELLVSRESALTGYLKSFQPHERIAAYRFAVRHARLQSALQLPTAAEAREAIAIPVPETAALSAATPQDINKTTVEPAATPNPQPLSPSPQSSVPVTAIQSQHSEDQRRYGWIKDLLHYPAVLIWGAQGSGKTSFASWLLRERILAGHKAEVWDVHREYDQWKGLPVYGDGMDYEAVNSRMKMFESQVKSDYAERAKNPNFNPKRHTVLVEEFTNFSRRCENAASFFEAALSDIRKIKKGVIFISHDRSLTALGGSKGFSKARNNGLVELQLEAVIDPMTGDPTPAMKGKLKLPGKPIQDVEIAEFMNGSMDFSNVIEDVELAHIATVEQQRLRAKLEGLYHQSGETEGETTGETDGEIVSPQSEMGETVKRSGETGETPHAEQVSDFGETGETISPNGETGGETGEITPDRVSRVCEMKRAGLNQTQIIAIEWGAKPGKSQAYLDAVSQYKTIIDRYWKE